MFTGIIECLGEVTKVEMEGTNKHLTIKSPISAELKIDQSIAHNGVCLTVVSLNDNVHIVTAIHETLIKSNIGDVQVGQKVNLERCMQANARIDGHFVQGHVDMTAICERITEHDGSWSYEFTLPDDQHDHLMVDKGSITINGTSLTLIKSDWHCFSVAIIPYTFEHTIFHQLNEGDTVNIEFDILGKYISKMYGRSEGKADDEEQ